MERLSRQKINKETLDLNNSLDQMNLTDIYRTFCPQEEEYLFFSSVHRTFYRTHHMLCCKTSLNKFKNTEIISSFFSDHNGMKIEINYKKKTRKFTNT